MRAGDFCTQRRGGLDGAAITWAAQKRQAGMAVQDIAKALGCSVETVAGLDLPTAQRKAPATARIKPPAPDGLEWRGRRSDAVLAHIAAAWGVAVEDLRGPSAARRMAYARYAAMAALKSVLGFSDRQIASAINRDRSTVYSGLVAHAALVESGELEAVRQSFMGLSHIAEPIGQIMAGLRPAAQ